MTNKLILILDEDLKAEAFINSTLEVEFIQGDDPDLIDTLAEVREHPKARVETRSAEEFSISFEPVTKDDPRYMDAIALELNARFFSAAVIPADLKKIFLELNERDISYAEREEAIAALVNMSDDDAKDFIKDLEELKTLSDESE